MPFSNLISSFGSVGEGSCLPHTDLIGASHMKKPGLNLEWSVSNFIQYREEIQTLAIVVAGALGLLVAFWRSVSAHVQAGAAMKQAEAALKNAEAALKNAEATSRTASNEQFSSSVGLLGHRNMAVRTGAVSALAELGRSNPTKEHVRVMALFAAFLAYPPRYSGGDREGHIDFDSNDTLQVIAAINRTGPEERHLEKEQGFDLVERLKNTAFPFVDGRVAPRAKPASTPWVERASPPPPPPGGIT